MELANLWSDLQIKELTKTNLKKDLTDGKVPQLPYFVIGIPEAKEAISGKLNEIDGERMLTSFIIAKYGNGKTNLLKYLELFFENHSEITTIYTTANVEQPDLGLFLLKYVQDHFTDLIIDYIVRSRNDYNFSTFTNGHPSSFASIKEYGDVLFKKSNTEDDLKRIIYLGTGRLYTKAEFAKFGLQQLSNYERKEVLVLFLNILAINRKFIIFQVDEIEKIYEKSKLRLNTFLTSYRELYDMFSFVRGHYLMCCLTDAGGDGAFMVGINDAFYSRILPHLLYLNNINGKDEIVQLIRKLNNLFDLHKTEEEIEKVVKELLKENHVQNRDLFRSAIAQLKSEDQKQSLSDLLVKYNLRELYDETKLELEYEGLFKSINQKFFDPLEAYLEGTFRLENGIIKSRDYQSFIDNELERIHYFILNDNASLESIQYRVDELLEIYDYNITVYSPEKLELSNGEIFSDKSIEIVDYEPKELFILLNMYRDNFEIQSELTKVITDYTNNNL